MPPVKPARKLKKRSRKGIPIYAEGTWTVIGEVRGDTFHKRIRASEHFLRQPPAICCDLAALNDALEVGATRLHVLDTESGRNYYVAIALMLAYGFEIDRGHHKQIALTLDEWAHTPEGQGVLI